MLFREKTAWVSIVSMAGVYGFYFWSIFQGGPRSEGVHSGELLGTIVALVIVQVGLIVVVAIASPTDAKAPRDERDRLIGLRAVQIAYYGLVSGVALACLFGAVASPIVFDANALLFVLVAAEILRSACLVFQYRRGA